jgi:prophage regulatory protein
MSKDMLSICRLPKVCRKTGLGKSTIYLRMESGDFPKPIRLGERAVGWIESEIDEWIQDRIHATRGSGESVDEA